MTRSTSTRTIDSDSRRKFAAYLLDAPVLARWNSLAACSSATDTEIFFAGDRGKQDQARVEEAKRICHSCPVRTDCREHSETMPERFGIWGGATAKERGWNNLGKRARI